MRTLLLFTLSLIATLSVSAQNSVLSQIETANAAYHTITATFSRIQYNAVRDTSVIHNGQLYIAAPHKMAQHYNAPSDEVFIINADYIYTIRGKKKHSYNTARNATMRRLRTTLLHCVHGTPATLAAETHAHIVAQQLPTTYEVVLTAGKKTPRGYARIVLNYDLHTKLLTRMQLYQHNGNYTAYEMSHLRTNVAIDDSLFQRGEEK